MSKRRSRSPSLTAQQSGSSGSDSFSPLGKLRLKRHKRSSPSRHFSYASSDPVYFGSRLPGDADDSDVSLCSETQFHPTSLPEILSQAWKVISARSSSAAPVSVSARPTFDTPIPGISSLPASRRPDSEVVLSALKTCDKFLEQPSYLQDNLVPLSSVRSLFRDYAPDSKRTVLAKSASASQPELQSRTATMPTTSKQQSVLEGAADFMTSASHFLCHISDVMADLNQSSNWSDQDVADFDILSRALSVVTRDVASLSAVQAVNLRLLRRDRALASASLPDAVASQCRHSTVNADDLFGPEADRAINTHRSSFPAALQATLPAILQQSRSASRGRPRGNRSQRQTYPSSSRRQGKRGRGRARGAPRGRGSSNAAPATATSSSATAGPQQRS